MVEHTCVVTNSHLRELDYPSIAFFEDQTTALAKTSLIRQLVHSSLWVHTIHDNPRFLTLDSIPRNSIASDLHSIAMKTPSADPIFRFMALDAFHTIHKTSVFEFPRDAVEHLQGNGGRSDSTHLNNVHKRKVSRGRKR